MSEAQSAALPQPVTLNGRIEFLAAARRLLMDTRYNASLLTQELDPRVFGEVSFADATRHLLLLHRHARLRVLVVRPQRAAQGPHALVELGRMLASRVEFREFAPGRPAPAGEMLLADGRLLLERSSADALESRLIREDPLAARERQKRFDNLWDHAVPSSELRRMRL